MSPAKSGCLKDGGVVPQANQAKVGENLLPALLLKRKMTGSLIEVASNNCGDISQMSIDKVGGVTLCSKPFSDAIAIGPDQI